MFIGIKRHAWIFIETKTSLSIVVDIHGFKLERYKKNTLGKTALGCPGCGNRDPSRAIAEKYLVESFVGAHPE